MADMAEPEPNQSFETRPQPRDPDPGRLFTIVFGLIVIAIGRASCRERVWIPV